MCLCVCVCVCVCGVGVGGSANPSFKRGVGGGGSANPLLKQEDGESFVEAGEQPYNMWVISISQSMAMRVKLNEREAGNGFLGAIGKETVVLLSAASLLLSELTPPVK